MARGRESRVGSTRTAPNGYHYTKTKEGWELTHRIKITAELGRDLRSNERVRFVDGDRTNLETDNLEVYQTKDQSYNKQIATLEAKIEEDQSKLLYLKKKQRESRL